MPQEAVILGVLQGLNALIVSASPLVVGATVAFKALIHALHSSGTEIKPFEEEITKFEGIISGGISVDDAWRAANGLPPWKTA
jgi:hypothetical protein